MTEQPTLGTIHEATCPACGFHVAVPFYDGAEQPLATIAWPASAAEARGMTRLPLVFVSCVDCGHVYNKAFTYDQVPYSDKPNLMFNAGHHWHGHLEAVIEAMAGRLPPNPTIVEIGHGDGSFIAALARRRPDGRYIGFDPHGCAPSADAPVEFRQQLFVPELALAELQPDLIISRHVLEHLTNPLGFMQRIGFAAARSGRTTALYIEVPCIDQAIATRRTVDFYFEHNSQFTTESFTRMLHGCTAIIDSISHGYGGEVISGFVRLGAMPEQALKAEAAERFRLAATDGLAAIQSQLQTLLQSGRRIVVWGGTGKSAAFINRYGLDDVRFPWVVDSDPLKVGTYVPGMGQVIRHRDWLLEQPADIVIIPPQWRARDILAEMAAHGLTAAQVLIEHQGQLIAFAGGDHPY